MNINTIIMLTIKNNIVYSLYNYSLTNDIMRLINVHIIFKHIETLLIQTFVGVPNSRNLIINRVSFFKEIKSMVSDVCLLFAKVLTRILEKHESLLTPLYLLNFRLCGRLTTWTAYFMIRNRVCAEKLAQVGYLG